MPTFTIYTDGGCNPNPGPGGWGALIISADGSRRELSGSAPKTTNNRMELTGALNALQSVPSGSAVELYTDSQYLRHGITEWIANWKRKGWKKSDGKDVLNRDLWEQLWAVIQHVDIKWHWVKGHANNVYNERVDALASAAIPREEVTSKSDATRLYIRVSCVGDTGGWAARVVKGNMSYEDTGRLRPTTSNKIELQATVAVIEQCPADELLEIYTANDYLYKGITQWLPGWKKRNWQTASGGPVKNADLWRKIDQINQARRIRWMWVSKNDSPAEFAGLSELASKARTNRA